MNVAPIRFSQEDFRIGRVDYEGEEHYENLRLRHEHTHVFRYDARDRKIANVTIVGGVDPLGVVERVPVDEHLLLLGKAVQRSILGWLSGRLTIIKRGKPLTFWGGANESKLLSRAVQDVAFRGRKSDLRPDPRLEVAVRYAMDTRPMWPPGDDVRPYLGLLVDLRTSNVIDLSVAKLLKLGVEVTGRYVCRRREEDDDLVLPRLETIGMVSEIDGGRLLLTDTTGVDEADAEEVLLEPRAENLEGAVGALYGRYASDVVSRLKQLRGPYASAAGKRQKIQHTLEGLRKRHSVLLDGGTLEATFGELLAQDSPSFPETIRTDRPGFLFGAQGRETGRYPDYGVRRFGPYKHMQHSKNEPLIAVVCEASRRGRVEQFAESLRAGFSEEAWREVTKRRRGKQNPNPFDGGLLDKYRLTRVEFEYEEVGGTSAGEYRAAIQRLLDRLARAPDLALVQTRERFRRLRGDDNPYFVSKAAFMGAGVPVQAVTEEKIEAEDGQLPYILNNVALATYAKLEGVPWVISTRAPSSRELVVGLGYTEVGEGRLGDRTRYVGITTLFQGDGRYLVWGLTREVEFANYAEALLTSLRTTIRYVKQENDWQPGDRVRLVFHVYKPLKNKEIEAIKGLVDDLVQEEYRVEYAFLDLSSQHMYQLFDPSQDGVGYRTESGKWRTKGKGVPERGICVQLDRRRALLQLAGPRELKTESQGAPQPLLVEVHPDSDLDDLTYLTRQIYHFTFLSWQSFFPATEPVTILYSRLIARVLGNLRLVAGWDSRVISVGALRENKWFL
jgi:hypothetical protein